MTGKNVHASFDNYRNEWKVKSEGAMRAEGYYPTADEAWERTQEIARGRGSEAIKHRKDNGQIHKRDTYGDDPYPPKG